MSTTSGIEKISKKLEDARNKAAQWQARVRELEKQKQEEENARIIQTVRSVCLSPEQLAAFLREPEKALSGPETPGRDSTAAEEGREEPPHETI